jgi:hypothetical protein
MKSELQNNLVKKYHVFFDWVKDIKLDQPIHPIQFGIECGDGWYWLLDGLMSSIYNYQKWNKKEGEDFIRIKQIKEKFGGLRFYIEGGNDKIHGMIWLAEHQSYMICEYCGTTEDVGRTSGWISVCCKNCHGKIDNRKDLEWKPNENKRLLKLERIKKLLNKNENIS